MKCATRSYAAAQLQKTSQHKVQIRTESCTSLHPSPSPHQFQRKTRQKVPIRIITCTSPYSSPSPQMYPPDSTLSNLTPRDFESENNKSLRGVAVKHNELKLISAMICLEILNSQNLEFEDKSEVIQRFGAGMWTTGTGSPVFGLCSLEIRQSFRCLQQTKSEYTGLPGVQHTVCR
jgi:hypothetical protein